jgi:hypothetical protein
MAEVNKSEAIRDFFKANPKAKSQEAADGLAKKGITVSVGLVNTVKSKHNKRQAARKAAKKQAAERKSNGVNKTQAVRDYLKAHKKAKNAEVVEALGEQGITITANYVGNIKATHNTRRRAVRKVVAKGGIGIPEIKSALAFIKTFGSISAAKKALDVAQEIRAIV